MEGVTFEHDHTLTFDDVWFDATTLRRLARLRIHKLNLERVPLLGEFYEEIANHPDDRPSHLKMTYEKNYGQAWNGNFIKMLQRELITELTVMFNQPILFPQALSTWENE